jgi:Eukaryotic aspartyl protease
VFNTQLPQASQTGHAVFNPANSTSFQKIDGATFRVTYGDNSFVSGTVGTDAVTIGSVTVSKQAVELPTEISPAFVNQTISDGIVGLGFSNLNEVRPQQQQTFFANVVSQLDEPVMTASLKAGGVGSYEFGTIDSTKYSGQIVNVSVDSSKGYWEFNSAQFYVGSGTPQEIQLAPTAIADTGTSLMLVSPEVVAEYYKQVQGACYVDAETGYAFPCGAQLPPLAMAVGDSHWAVVPSSVLNYSVVGTNTTTNELSTSLTISPPRSCHLIRPYSVQRRHPIQPGLQYPSLWRRFPQIHVRHLRPKGAVARISEPRGGNEFQ